MTKDYPQELLYTKKHLWYDPENCWVGITKNGQEELGEVVYTELPEPGEQIAAGGHTGSDRIIESYL